MPGKLSLILNLTFMKKTLSILLTVIFFIASNAFSQNNPDSKGDVPDNINFTSRRAARTESLCFMGDCPFVNGGATKTGEGKPTRMVSNVGIAI